MKLLLLVQKATTYNCITNCMCFSKYVSMYVQYVQYVHANTSLLLEVSCLSELNFVIVFKFPLYYSKHSLCFLLLLIPEIPKYIHKLFWEFVR